MRIITVTNQKGGAGKSVLATNLVFLAIEEKKRVLALDLDPQGSMSMVTFKGHKPQLKSSEFVSELIEAHSLGENEYLMSAVASSSLRRVVVDEKILAKNLKKYEGLVDVVIIDTAGSINTLAQAAMMCSTHVVCPVEVGAYELDALLPLLENIKTVQKQFNPKLVNLGLLPSKVYTQSAVTRSDLAMLRESLGKRVMPFQLSFRAAVQLSVKLKKAVWRVAKTKAAKDEWLQACKAILN